ALSILPFARAIRFGSINCGERTSGDVEQYVWAVQAAARRLPWRTVCIQQGLALQRLLRGSGHDSILHYGARHASATGKLEAHVWVSLASSTLIGGPEADGFVEIASFP
ncbi:MAG: lasso peptide biosynthesis B2 protein, partial [Verrucomicrobiaceae bacterium]|nr:lasso peptide biosynthesis B2 protein [Verrucomicrobiaceae bacterium]